MGTGLNGRMPSLPTLDERSIIAFVPRFEAARFLVDLLLLSSNVEDPQVYRCVVDTPYVLRETKNESSSI